MLIILLPQKARPTTGDSSLSEPWSRARDSVLSTPNSMTNLDLRKIQGLPYDDSDDQDSVGSEPWISRDVAMSAVDEEMEGDDCAPLTQPHHPHARSPMPHKPWQSLQPRMQQANRVPTPMLPLFSPSRPGLKPIQVRTGMGQHVRHRHPQENLSNSSDLLEVPSPIDEDEVPTPPSAAEAAGSQLSMLSVNDMDMEAADLPTISINPAQSYSLNEQVGRSPAPGSAIIDDFEPMEATSDLTSTLLVRKQRARSGALSSGHGSLTQAEPMRPDSDLSSRRAFSIGFRADCERCRARVPGHMNHFIS